MGYKTRGGWTIEHGSCSNSNYFRPGHRRNEDSFISSIQASVFGVADGMGAFHMPSVASKLALETLLKEIYRFPDWYMPPYIESDVQLVVNDIFNNIDQTIKSYAEERKLSSIGTTLSFVKLFADADSAAFVAANVGNSPILLFREVKTKGQMQAFMLYGDDSVMREGKPYGLKQFLGMGYGKEGMSPHVKLMDLLPGDIILECSDAVIENIPIEGKQGLKALIRENPDPEEIVDAAMKSRKKIDDITVSMQRVFR